MIYMKFNSTLLEGPEVSISHETEAVFDTDVMLKASIRSFMKDTSTMWMKGDKKIDITMSKYNGSSVVGNCPVLCINNVSEEDEAMYAIYVRNEWDETCPECRLVVTGSKCHFFSSPELRARVNLTDYFLFSVRLSVFSSICLFLAIFISSPEPLIEILHSYPEKNETLDNILLGNNVV